MKPESFYEPTDRGFEARVRERLAFWAEKRREKARSTDGE